MNIDRTAQVHLRWMMASHVVLLALIVNLLFFKFHSGIVTFFGIVLVASIRLIASRQSKAAQGRRC